MQDLLLLQVSWRFEADHRSQFSIYKCARWPTERRRDSRRVCQRSRAFDPFALMR